MNRIYGELISAFFSFPPVSGFCIGAFVVTSAHVSRRRIKNARWCGEKLIGSSSNWLFRIVLCKDCIICFSICFSFYSFAVDIRADCLVHRFGGLWRRLSVQLIPALISVTTRGWVTLTQKWIAGVWWMFDHKFSIVMHSNVRRARIFSDGQFRWHFECAFKLMSSLVVNKAVRK